MKQFIQLVLLLMIGLSLSVTQAQIIESFDSDISLDTTYQISTEGFPSRMDFTLNTTDFMEGTGAGEADIVIGAFHEWGSYAQLIKRVPEGEPLFDWSISDSLAIWIKVLSAPTIPANMVFRIHIADQPSPGDPVEEYIYEHATVLDQVGDWFELKLPLKILSTDGSMTPNDTGFVIFPTGWGGGSYNNNQFDSTKIVGFNISAITSGYTPGTNIPADSLVVIFDGFRRFGLKAVSAIIFNGIAFPSHVSEIWAWGQSTIEVETGAGPEPNTNAVKWVQGNEWGNGWTGMGTTINPPFNLAGAWGVDSVKFKLKCEDGVGALRIQFEGGAGKVGTVFQPMTDNQWHSYSFALREMVYQDGTSDFDSSNVHVVGMMAEGSGIAGKIIYLTDWWTGNPVFDVIPPPPPQNVDAFAGDKQNIVTWDDVPGETGEKYDVYYSKYPITDLTSTQVEVVKFNIPENNQLATHLLFAPVTNQDVTYYYAVICKDASGNKSEISVNSDPVTNTAKGVTTISLNAPNFVADGDMSEWQSITPFRMFPSDGSGHIVTNTTISGDDDLSVNAWVAVDENYLYVAFDITDDIIVPNAQALSYLNDCPDIFLGLYNWHGAPHTTLRRGNEPDYHFRFAYNKVILDGLADSIAGLGTDYYWGERFPSGYNVEFRISWTDLAAIGNDNVFAPLEGMRIPIDYSINDADATNEREGILCYSVNNEDQSWGDVSRWAHTWIGALWDPVGVEDEIPIVNEYRLAQNYPNPFNPSTRIQYSLKESGFVTLKVYDVLGREVSTLISQEQNAGIHTVVFDASDLSTGIYFYKLESGSYVQVNKMILLK